MSGLSHALLNPELPDGDLLDKWMQNSSQTTQQQSENSSATLMQ